MKKPRTRKPGTTHSISCADGEWDRIQTDAARQGKSASDWFVECALTVDLSPKDTAACPLTLDAKEQRYISRAMERLARGAHSNRDRRFADDIRALLRARLDAMVRDGRRDEAVDLVRLVFGEERTEAIVAAFIGDVPMVPPAPDRLEKADPKASPHEERPAQHELF